MSITLDVLFLLLAMVSFGLAAFGVRGPWLPVGLIFICLFLWP